MAKTPIRPNLESCYFSNAKQCIPQHHPEALLDFRAIRILSSVHSCEQIRTHGRTDGTEGLDNPGTHHGRREVSIHIGHRQHGCSNTENKEMGMRENALSVMREEYVTTPYYGTMRTG